MLDMSKGAEKIINVCLKLKEGESLVIVTEESRLTIAEAVLRAAQKVTDNAELVLMEPRHHDGEEPPEDIRGMMEQSDSFILVVGKSITHTNAVKSAVSKGGRGLVLTHFTEEMMVKGGIECDFPAIKPVCIKMAEAMAGSEEIVLTSPSGTHLTYSAKGRRGNHLYCMVEKGEFSTLPTVEANVSPLEGTAEGVIVADASIPYIGIGVLEEPVTLKVEKGRVVDIKGGYQAEMLKKDWEEKNDPNVYNIAEHGVGLNPNCHFCGFMLEDEGVYGTCHIGIGTSITLGGNVKAKCHYDVIMNNGTIVADGRVLMENGVVKI